MKKIEIAKELDLKVLYIDEATIDVNGIVVCTDTYSTYILVKHETEQFEWVELEDNELSGRKFDSTYDAIMEDIDNSPHYVFESAKEFAKFIIQREEN